MNWQEHIIDILTVIIWLIIIVININSHKNLKRAEKTLKNIQEVNEKLRNQSSRLAYQSSFARKEKQEEDKDV